MSSESPQGWHARASPYAPTAGLTPTKDALVFVVRLNAQAVPDGFIMALFHPDIAIDARGRVLRLHPHDFSALASLAGEVTHLPDTGSFMNTWRISHAVTCQPIRILSVKTPSGELKQTSVYGWHPTARKLDGAVGEYEELPSPLHALFGYIEESGADFQWGEEENKELIEQVKDLVEDQR